MDNTTSGKLPGKTEYSGRRRITTRKSGFNSHPDSTGGEYKVTSVDSQLLMPGEQIIIDFKVSDVIIGDFVSYGGWFNAPEGVDIVVSGGPEKKTLIQTASPNWSKFGSLWVADSDDDVNVRVVITSASPAEVALYELACGIVKHRHLDWAKEEKPVLLGNMFEISPEANFITTPGIVKLDLPEEIGEKKSLTLKSCNRCARFLPINTDNQRVHLSFSNHCVAPHRRPCSHGGFGKLKNIDNPSQILELEYGYQLECRFCKKFEVNAAHNPQRTAAQMKEDGARRRAIELLLTELYGGSDQLRFRHANNGLELTDYIWLKFDKKCFNCGVGIESGRSMHLDHTRPLALMWPLDSTATCLCGSCNSSKRDRPPAEFYAEQKLLDLASISGLGIDELKDPSPNIEAIDILCERIDWFFDSFLLKPELTKVRDGKTASELLVKALQKTINRYPGGAPIDVLQLYKQKFL